MRRLLLFWFSLSLATACDNSISDQTHLQMTPVEPPVHAALFRHDQPAAALAQALATVLADVNVRQQLFEDLRDSPFPEHAIHLRSYFEGTRGRRIAQALARRLGISHGDLDQLLSEQPNLVIVMPSRVHRTEWQGGPDLVVFGSDSERTELSSLADIRGYSPDGTHINFHVLQPAVRPVLALIRSEIDFGSDPELRRARALKRNTKTVSAPAEEFIALSECDRTARWCGGEQGNGDGPAINVGADCGIGTFDVVTSDTDRDSDGIKDECEWRFASTFEPQLIREQWEAYFGREPAWMVRKDSFNHISIIYLLSYYYDGGWWSHAGDSEFIIVQLRAQYNDRWSVARMTTSAHWRATGDMTATTDGSTLEYSIVRPYVYVSREHHANYATKARCDARIGDNCSPNLGWNTERIGITRERNLGQAWAPFDLDPTIGGNGSCTYSRIRHPSGLECYFTGTSFAGWYVNNSGTTPYVDPLRFFGFM